MVYFCERCMKTHDEDELCPEHFRQLQDNPYLLSEAADFVGIVGQHRLITSQDLSKVLSLINKASGTNFSYEGTHQFVRDIQVFNRLNTEAYVKAGYFNTPESALEYLKNATKAQLSDFSRKASGSAQEVDWLRDKMGQLKSIFEKSELLNGNAPGVDGVTKNRITNETISRTTIKAAQSSKGMGRNVSDVIEALHKGTLNTDEILVGVKGTDEAIQKALKENLKKAIADGDVEFEKNIREAIEKLKVQELNTMNDQRETVERLKNKIEAGKATTEIGRQQVVEKMANGAIIGAAVSLTISSVSTFLRYKNGQLTIHEAFTEIAEDTAKGTLIGGGMAGISLFLPAGMVGFIGGVAIGIYVNTSLKNILDEVFGKGAYKEILISSGYIAGMSANLYETAQKISKNSTITEARIDESKRLHNSTVSRIKSINKLLEE